MTTQTHLRPLERRVLAMRDEGIAIDEIAQRIRRSPAYVDRVIVWTDLPRAGPPTKRSPRAIERRVLTLRAKGESHEEIGQRFGRSAQFIRQVEGLAHYTQGLDLLS